MLRRLSKSIALWLVMSVPLWADAPRVTTDIGPVHGLVARVMQGIGAADLVVRPGASPHDYAMRPSEAAALEAADIVVWIGPALTPWLAHAMETLAADATFITLMDVEGTHRLPLRQGADLAGHNHSHDEGDHAGDAHDPHAWLDPENARLWLQVIGEALAGADPDNAAAYRENAQAGRAEIAELMAEVNTRLAPLRDRPFIVFHDSFGYFEHRFGLSATGAISPGDAAAPGPARLAAIRQIVREHGVSCIFSEPQSGPGLADAALEGTAAEMVVIDPLGGGLAPGADFYLRLMSDLAGRMTRCLSP